MCICMYNMCVWEYIYIYMHIYAYTYIYIYTYTYIRLDIYIALQTRSSLKATRKPKLLYYNFLKKWSCFVALWSFEVYTKVYTKDILDTHCCHLFFFHIRLPWRVTTCMHGHKILMIFQRQTISQTGISLRKIEVMPKLYAWWLFQLFQLSAFSVLTGAKDAWMTVDFHLSRTAFTCNCLQTAPETRQMTSNCLLSWKCWLHDSWLDNWNRCLLGGCTNGTGYTCFNRGFDSDTRRIQIGMFRPIRVDHTNCLQVAI